MTKASITCRTTILIGRGSSPHATGLQLDSSAGSCRWATRSYDAAAVISGTAKRMTGHSPPMIDTLFAATALEHDLYLVTRNIADVRASGAQIFDPSTDDAASFPLSPMPRSRH